MISNFKDKYIKKIIDSLLADGKSLITQAYMTHNTETRTGNQNAAYGAAVYYRGRIVGKEYVDGVDPNTKIHRGWKKNGIPADTGRGYLDKFFGRYKPEDDGIYLICVNAVWYSSILENGSFRTQYRIMSQTKGTLDRLARNYGGIPFSLRR